MGKKVLSLLSIADHRDPTSMPFLLDCHGSN